MAHTVRRRLTPRRMPRMSLANPPTAPMTREGLAVLIETARDRAITAATGSGMPNETINAYIARSNEVLDELRSSAGTIPARLEREAAEITAALSHIATTGAEPEGGVPGGRKIPWKLIGLGALGLGAIWWWASQQRESAIDAAIDAAIESGDLEDCGCGG